MTVINCPPHTAAIQGIMVIASIREVGECLVYLTSWLLCRPRGPLTLRRAGDGEKAPELCWEYRSTHNKSYGYCSTGRENWNWGGKTRQCIQVSHYWLSDFRSRMTVTSHLTFFNPIFFFYCVLGAFCIIFLWNIAWKLLRIKFTQLSILQRGVCCVAVEAQLLFVFTHKQKHTLMSLPDPCLNGSRYYPDISPLSRVLFSSWYVVHTSGLSSSSFTWSSAASE